MAYQPTHHQSEHDSVSLGDIVFVSRNRIGVVRYIGHRASESGVWIGVDLKYDYDDGCDGCSYFNTTGKRTGLFVRSVERKVHYHQLLDKAAMHTLALSQAQMYFILEETMNRNEQILSATNNFFFAELEGRINDVKRVKQLYDERSRDPDGLPFVDESALAEVLQTILERHSAARSCRLVDLKQLSVNNAEWIPQLTAVMAMVRTEKKRRRDAAKKAYGMARRNSIELKSEQDLRELQQSHDEQQRQYDKDRENWAENKKGLQRVIETKEQELHRLRREVEQLRANLSASQQGVNRAAAESMPTTRTQHRSRPSQIAEDLEETKSDIMDERNNSATKPPREQPMAPNMGMGVDVAELRREQQRLLQEAHRVKQCLDANQDIDPDICWEFNLLAGTCRRRGCTYRHRYYVNKKQDRNSGGNNDDIITRYLLTKGECMNDPRLWDMNVKRPALTAEEINNLTHILDALTTRSHSPRRNRRHSMGPAGL